MRHHATTRFERHSTFSGSAASLRSGLFLGSRSTAASAIVRSSTTWTISLERSSDDENRSGEPVSGANSGGRTLFAIAETLGRRYRSLSSLGHKTWTKLIESPSLAASP